MGRWGVVELTSSFLPQPVLSRDSKQSGVTTRRPGSTREVQGLNTGTGDALASTADEAKLSPHTLWEVAMDLCLDQLTIGPLFSKTSKKHLEQ